MLTVQQLCKQDAVQPEVWLSDPDITNFTFAEPISSTDRHLIQAAETSLGHLGVLYSPTEFKQPFPFLLLDDGHDHSHPDLEAVWLFECLDDIVDFVTEYQWNSNLPEPRWIERPRGNKPERLYLLEESLQTLIRDKAGERQRAKENHPPTDIDQTPTPPADTNAGQTNDDITMSDKDTSIFATLMSAPSVQAAVRGGDQAASYAFSAEVMGLAERLIAPRVPFIAMLDETTKVAFLGSIILELCKEERNVLALPEKVRGFTYNRLESAVTQAWAQILGPVLAEIRGGIMGAASKEIGSGNDS